MRTIKIAALNITMHAPHSPQRYVDLMQRAHASYHIVRLGKLHAAMLGGLYAEEEVDKDGVPKELNGEIYRFVYLDATKKWFNTRTKDEATPQDVSEISIPPHLLPELQRMPFVFRPRGHKLLYVSEDRGDRMGPQTATTFFQRLFDHVLTKHRFPDVDVTAVPSMDALDDMLKLPKLERLTIELTRPNPDDLGDERAKLMKKLERWKAKKLVTQLVAESGESLQPDADTRQLAEVAAQNGKVSVVGKDASGTRVEDSTAARPLIIPEQVDEHVESTMQVLRRTSLH